MNKRVREKKQVRNIYSIWNIFGVECLNNERKVELTLLLNQRVHEVYCQCHVVSIAKSTNFLHPVTMLA